MEEIAERYRRFARLECAGRSALYEQLALHVAKSPDILTFLSRMPVEKQQPNLLFAAIRLVAGTPSSAADFEDAVSNHSDAVTSVMMTRTTQTTEPGRCAGLLPALARFQGPLALIEVGTSAGLCLLPDYYGYDWGKVGWNRKSLLKTSLRHFLAVLQRRFRCRNGIRRSSGGPGWT